MITVSIAINAEPIAARTAVRVKTLENGNRLYKLDCGTEITHNPTHGAVALAKQMLDAIQVVVK